MPWSIKKTDVNKAATRPGWARACPLSRAQGNPESASAWWQYEAVPANQCVGVPLFAMSGWCCNELRIPWTEQKSPSPPPATQSIHLTVYPSAPTRHQAESSISSNRFPGSTATYLPPDRRWTEERRTKWCGFCSPRIPQHRRPHARPLGVGALSPLSTTTHENVQRRHHGFKPYRPRNQM